jgi:hypothetical protein
MIFHIYHPVDIISIRQIHARLASPTAELSQALAKEIGTDTDTARHALRSYTRGIEMPRAGLSVPPAPWLANVPVTQEGLYTHTKPYGFQLGVWACQASSWRDMVSHCAEILYLEHENVFQERVMRIKGPERVYFSHEPSDLTAGREIFSSGLYVETNLSADNSFSLISRMAEAFEYNPPKIITEFIW